MEEGEDGGRVYTYRYTVTTRIPIAIPIATPSPPEYLSLYLSLHRHHQNTYRYTYRYTVTTRIPIAIPVATPLPPEYLSLYLSLHRHHQNDACIKTGPFSLIVKNKVTRQYPQNRTFFEEKGKPMRNQAAALLLTSLTARPNRLTVAAKPPLAYMM